MGESTSILMIGDKVIFMAEGTLRVNSYSWLRVHSYSRARGTSILMGEGTAISMTESTLRLYP